MRPSTSPRSCLASSFVIAGFLPSGWIRGSQQPLGRSKEGRDAGEEASADPSVGGPVVGGERDGQRGVRNDPTLRHHRALDQPPNPTIDLRRMDDAEDRLHQILAGLVTVIVARRLRGSGAPRARSTTSSERIVVGVEASASRITGERLPPPRSATIVATWTPSPSTGVPSTTAVHPSTLRAASATADSNAASNTCREAAVVVSRASTSPPCRRC
jgi:hypothetical protein